MRRHTNEYWKQCIGNRITDIKLLTGRSFTAVEAGDGSWLVNQIEDHNIRQVQCDLTLSQVYFYLDGFFTGATQGVHPNMYAQEG